VKKQSPLILVFTVFFAINAANLFAIGAGVTGLNFLKISQGARPSGMGEAFTGIADDVNAIFWNPAGLGELTRHQVTFMHTAWMMDVNFQYLAYALPVKGAGTFGIYGVLLNAGEINKTIEDSMGQYQSTDEKAGASSIHFTAAYAKKLSDILGEGNVFSALNAGISLGFSSEEIYTDSGSGFGADISFYYAPKYEKYSAGLIVQNAGVSTNRPGMPLTMRLGFGYRFAFEGILNAFSDDGYFMQLDEDTAAGIDIIYYPTEALARVNAGAEKFWTLSKYHKVALRFGYKFGYDLGIWSGFTFGAGYRLAAGVNSAVELDYVYSPYGDLGDSHRISITGKFLGAPETREHQDKKAAVEYYREGYELLNNRNYPEAVQKFSEALKRDRDHAPSYMGMGASFLRLGKTDTARRVYLIALEKDPGNKKLMEFIESYNWGIGNP